MTKTAKATNIDAVIIRTGFFMTSRITYYGRVKWGVACINLEGTFGKHQEAH